MRCSWSQVSAAAIHYLSLILELDVIVCLLLLSGCSRQYDVSLILDLSGSMDQEYRLTIELAKKIVYGLDMNLDRTRFSAMAFSDNVFSIFYLNTYQGQKDGVINALNYYHHGGRTNTQVSRWMCQSGSCLQICRRCDYLKADLPCKMYLPMLQTPDSKVHGANMGPTWVLSAPDGPHVGPMNFALRDIPAFGIYYVPWHEWIGVIPHCVYHGEWIILDLF